MSKETVQEKVQEDVQSDQLSDLKQNRDMLIEFMEKHKDGKVFLFGPMMSPNAFHVTKENTCYPDLGFFIGELIEGAISEINKLEKL